MALAVDGDGKLKGVVPTRRLLSAPLDQRVSELMIGRGVAVPELPCNPPATQHQVVLVKYGRLAGRDGALR